MATSIGAFSFVRMSEHPTAAQQQIAIESRSGAVGVAAWKIGARGSQYQVETVADTATYATAAALMASYYAAVGSGALAVVVGGVSMASSVIVLKVEPVEVTGTVINVGGLVGNGRGICRARWTLMAWV